MLIETALVVSFVIPPPEVSPPRSPYEHRWWEEEEVPKEMSFGVPGEEEEMFRLLIEEVLKGYESSPWPRQEP